MRVSLQIPELTQAQIDILSDGTDRREVEIIMRGKVLEMNDGHQETTLYCRANKLKVVDEYTGRTIRNLLRDTRRSTPEADSVSPSSQRSGSPGVPRHQRTGNLLVGQLTREWERERESERSQDSRSERHRHGEARFRPPETFEDAMANIWHRHPSEP